MRCGWGRVRDEGFAAGPISCWAITHIWIIDGTVHNDGAKAFWPWPKRLRSVVFASKQTVLDGSAQLFECVPVRQTEHFATISQFFFLKRWRRFNLCDSLKKNLPLCFMNSTNQDKEERLFDRQDACVCLALECRC